jgi:hypothetical protein
MKKCTKCGELKPLAGFCKDRKSRDGHAWECKACNTARAVKWKSDNAEKARVTWQLWYADNCEKRRAESLRWARENPEKKRAQANKWSAENREKVRAWGAEWRAENPEKVRAKAARRRAQVLCATPAWADHAKINAVYAWAKHLEELGVKCHVDHIVPLQGELVCGLHVHYNLRVVIDIENIKKHNVLLDPFEPCEYDMPGFRQWMEDRSCT